MPVGLGAMSVAVVRASGGSWARCWPAIAAIEHGAVAAEFGFGMSSRRPSWACRAIDALVAPARRRRAGRPHRASAGLGCRDCPASSRISARRTCRRSPARMGIIDAGVLSRTFGCRQPSSGANSLNRLAIAVAFVCAIVTRLRPGVAADRRARLDDQLLRGSSRHTSGAADRAASDSLQHVFLAATKAALASGGITHCCLRAA